MNFKLLGKIASGWVTAPLFACILSFVSLFIIQNVFSQPVYREVKYSISESVAARLQGEGITFSSMGEMINIEFRNAAEFRYAIEHNAPSLDKNSMMRVIKLSEVRNITVDPELIKFEISQGAFTEKQVEVLNSMKGKNYVHTWEFAADLAASEPEWQIKPDVPSNRLYNSSLKTKIEYLAAKFSGQR